jgi:hypothetical protein
VEQHPEARDRLPEGAWGEAHLGEVFGGEGIVIMVVEPSSNGAHSSPQHYHGPPPAFQHLSRKLESFPFGGPCLYVVESKEEQMVVEHDEAGRLKSDPDRKTKNIVTAVMQKQQGKWKSPDS